MPTRDGYPEGVPSWVDLGTNDLGTAMEFYAALFGWVYEDVESESTPYTMASRKGLSAAGLGANPDPEMPSAWSTYFAVDSADATSEKIISNGGSLIMEPFDVMDAGRMAFATDRSGAAFGIWQTVDHFGAAIVNEHGSLNWNELQTDDLEGAQAFYGGVFGWGFETHQQPNGPYVTFSVDGRAVGGMMVKPDPSFPNYWGCYFAVDDTNAAIETAREKGGAVTYGPMEVPDVGVFAGLVDPTGAHLTVIQLANVID